MKRLFNVIHVVAALVAVWFVWSSFYVVLSKDSYNEIDYLILAIGFGLTASIAGELSKHGKDSKEKSSLQGS